MRTSDLFLLFLPFLSFLSSFSCVAVGRERFPSQENISDEGRAGANKLWLDRGWTETMIDSIQRSAQRFSFYQSFIDTVVLAHAEVFASLVAWGEFAAGLSILVGVATRLGSGVGMFLSINDMFLQGRFFPGYDGTLLFAQLVLFLAAAGRVLGVELFPVPQVAHRVFGRARGQTSSGRRRWRWRSLRAF